MYPVSYNDFIGASIKHMYEDSKSKENAKWDAEIEDVDLQSTDEDNQAFFILSTDSSDNTIDFSKINDSAVGLLNLFLLIKIP